MAYQKIQIGDKILTGGIDRSKEYEWMFPEPPRGKTILDIGCHTGYYTLRSAYEGAKLSIGTDINVGVLKKASDFAKTLGLANTQFRIDDIEKTQLQGAFDITLCLNVLHHLSTIERAEKILKIIDQLTLEEIFFIVSSPKNLGDLYVEDTNSKTKKQKVRISPIYFKDLWPNYKITYRQSFTFEERFLVKVNK